MDRRSGPTFHWAWSSIHIVCNRHLRSTHFLKLWESTLFCSRIFGGHCISKSFADIWFDLILDEAPHFVESGASSGSKVFAKVTYAIRTPRQIPGRPIMPRIYHITYGPGVPEHSAGNRINALVQYRFLLPGFALIMLLKTGHKWRHLWWRYCKQCHIFTEIYRAEAVLN